jgi:hypothetical protein
VAFTGTRLFSIFNWPSQGPFHSGTLTLQAAHNLTSLQRRRALGRATFKNGVLTVTLPKTERELSKSKRIAINGSSQ